MARSINVVSSSQLAPEAWKVFLESSSKPLVITGQLTSWFRSRSWRAIDICQALSSVPSTSFKLCPRKDTPLYKTCTDGGSRVLFETDCLHVEASFADFKEWLVKNHGVGIETRNSELGLRESNGQRLGHQISEPHERNPSLVCEEPTKKRARVANQQEDEPDVKSKFENPLLAFPGSQYWVYADYKYMCNVCPDVPELQDPVDWGILGFKDRGGRDSALWVGSEGACTPCHYDTYGFNLVAQLSGEKKWMMFPPDDTAKMYPTRVPFEETSVFSEVDVERPDFVKYPKFRETTPYKVINGG